MQRNGSLARLLAQQAPEPGCRERTAHYAPHVIVHGEVCDGAAALVRLLARSRDFFGSPNGLARTGRGDRYRVFIVAPRYT